MNGEPLTLPEWGQREMVRGHAQCEEEGGMYVLLNDQFALPQLSESLFARGKCPRRVDLPQF